MLLSPVGKYSFKSCLFKTFFFSGICTNNQHGAKFFRIASQDMDINKILAVGCRILAFLVVFLLNSVLDPLCLASLWGAIYVEL